jgi:hypothetical protein
MPIEKVPDQPGLWREPGWKPQTPGVYALIAGVSRYPHLPDGGGPEASDAFGLAQLGSSASTAASLFEWLRGGFRHDGLPLVWCRLLLSPTAKETKALDAAGITHYAEPTDANLKFAIQSWTGAVPAKDLPASESRTLFFFSGHGVQSHWTPVLLPSDYLDPQFGAPQLQNCISAAELRKWMEQHPAGEHLALLDACRNEFDPLASLGATANSVFPLQNAAGGVPRTAATLMTTPNTFAYQLPGRPYTVFGEAVLEAVRGMADPAGGKLAFRKFVDYVKPRVNAILRDAGASAEQSVRPSVDGDDGLVVTDLAPPAPAGPLHAALTAPAPAQPMMASHGQKRRMLRTEDRIAVDLLRGDLNESVRRFGHEYASMIWERGQVAFHSLQDGARLQDAAEVLAVERNEESSVVHVDLGLSARSSGVLMVFEGNEHVHGGRLAVALPTDENGEVPVRVSMMIARAGAEQHPKIGSVTARLGAHSTNDHYLYLWTLAEHARFESTLEAAKCAEPGRLKAAVQDKLRAETAAIASALLLARAGQIDKVGNWPCNIMNWFPLDPDGAVAWAEALRDAQRREDRELLGRPVKDEDIAAAVCKLLERGVPFFADSLDFADRQVRELLHTGIGEPWQSKLQLLAGALERFFEVGTPAGEFVAVRGLPRPSWQSPGEGPLTVQEMIAILRGPPKR